MERAEQLRPNCRIETETRLKCFQQRNCTQYENRYCNQNFH